MALAKHTGRDAAHKIMNAASHRAIAEHRHLRSVLVEDVAVTKYLSASEIDGLFDPLSYVGVARQFIDRVLATHQNFSEAGKRG